MTRHEQAAAMRDAGSSIEEIMSAFGWPIRTALVMVSRGRNADQYRASRRAYYAANKELCSARHKRWRDANPDKVREIKRKYRAKRRQQSIGGEA